MIVIVGIFYFAVYYLLFHYLIIKFDYKTPGRELESEEVKLFTKKDMAEKKDADKKAEKTVNSSDALSSLICAGLGLSLIHI